MTADAVLAWLKTVNFSMRSLRESCRPLIRKEPFSGPTQVAYIQPTTPGAGAHSLAGIQRLKICIRCHAKRDGLVILRVPPLLRHCEHHDNGGTHSGRIMSEYAGRREGTSSHRHSHSASQGRQLGRRINRSVCRTCAKRPHCRHVDAPLPSRLPLRLGRLVRSKATLPDAARASGVHSMTETCFANTVSPRSRELPRQTAPAHRSCDEFFCHVPQHEIKTHAPGVSF